jgi:hypothetical protein
MLLETRTRESMAAQRQFDATRISIADQFLDANVRRDLAT